MRQPDLPKYLLVERHIRAAIKRKEISDKLPSERALAKRLGFSYMTIRKALEILERDGLIYKLPQKGSFVNRGDNLRKTRLIGYFLDGSIRSGISSPYYSLVFDAITKEAAKNGYSALYFSEFEPRRPSDQLARLDGVIASCFPRNEKIVREMSLRLPVVVIDNRCADESIPSVLIDNHAATLNAFNHLLSLGRAPIAFMAGLDDSAVGADRYAGYLHGLRANRLAVDESLVYKGDYSRESGARAAEYFLGLEKLPGALICANDSMALGVMKRFNQSGVRAPEDIAIVGFDDIKVAAQVIPSLTTNAVPTARIAREAFSRLKSLIDGRQPSDRHLILSARLVVRESCSSGAKRFDARPRSGSSARAKNSPHSA